MIRQGIDPVHLGHADIHDDQIRKVVRILQPFQDFPTVAGQDDS